MRTFLMIDLFLFLLSFFQISLVSFCITTLTLLFTGKDVQRSSLIAVQRGPRGSLPPQQVFQLQALGDPEPITFTKRLPQALIIGVPFGGTSEFLFSINKYTDTIRISSSIELISVYWVEIILYWF